MSEYFSDKRVAPMTIRFGKIMRLLSCSAPCFALLFLLACGGGGVGDFQVFTRAQGLNGHFIINDSALWGPAVAAYLNQFE